MYLCLYHRLQIKVTIDVEEEAEEEEKDKDTVAVASHSSEGMLTKKIKDAAKEKAQNEKDSGLTESKFEFDDWQKILQELREDEKGALLPYPINGTDNSTISDQTYSVPFDSKPPSKGSEQSYEPKVDNNFEAYRKGEGAVFKDDTKSSKHSGTDRNSSELMGNAHMDIIGTNIGDSGEVLTHQELANRRIRKGERPTCGQKCFGKKLFKFKSKPLTIEGKVLKGQCLVCKPLRTDSDDLIHATSAHTATPCSASNRFEDELPLQHIFEDDMFNSPRSSPINNNTEQQHSDSLLQGSPSNDVDNNNNTMKSKKKSRRVGPVACRKANTGWDNSLSLSAMIAHSPPTSASIGYFLEWESYSAITMPNSQQQTKRKRNEASRKRPAEQKMPKSTVKRAKTDDTKYHKQASMSSEEEKDLGRFTLRTLIEKRMKREDSPNDNTVTIESVRVDQTDAFDLLDLPLSCWLRSTDTPKIEVSATHIDKAIKGSMRMDGGIPLLRQRSPSLRRLLFFTAQQPSELI